METFEILLKQQLRGCLGSQRDDDKSYRSRPIVREILCHSRGAKEAVEIATKAYIYTWIHYGHLAVGADLSGIKGDDKNETRQLGDLVASQTERLVRSMGKTLSYLAVLYSEETHEPMDAVAYLIGNIAQRELSESAFDPSALVEDDPDKLQIRIKLGFILRLDRQVAPRVLSKLADMLGVAPQFNAIFDN